MFEDPDYVLDGIEAGVFDGGMLAEAVEVRRRAARIRVPRDVGEEQEVVVLYHLLPDRSFGGFVIVAKSDPRLADYKRFSAAQSDGLDMTMPRRIAPGDRTATKGMLEGARFQLFADPHRRVTPRECVAFFDDADNFLE